MKQEKTTVVEHHNFQGEYRILRLAAPETGPLVKPGQFLHLLIPHLGDRILRRPFSIYKADAEGVSILYKPVGRGTDSMRPLQVGDTVDIIGPLGNGFDLSGKLPDVAILVGGGFGLVPLFPLAAALRERGKDVYVFVGTEEDLVAPRNKPNN